jgi:hypothetical protein
MRQICGRCLPFAVAVLALIVGLVPLWIDTVNASDADLWTLLLAAGVFAFKSALFFWMRYRMTTDRRRLTTFGMALVDFFTALTVLAVVLAVTFTVNAAYAWGDPSPPPVATRTIMRACIVGAGVLVVATGIAAAWEMRRAGLTLSVHDEAWDGTTDRRVGPPDRRQSVAR